MDAGTPTYDMDEAVRVVADDVFDRFRECYDADRPEPKWFCIVPCVLSMVVLVLLLLFTV